MKDLYKSIETQTREENALTPSSIDSAVERQKAAPKTSYAARRKRMSLVETDEGEKEHPMMIKNLYMQTLADSRGLKVKDSVLPTRAFHRRRPTFL